MFVSLPGVFCVQTNCAFLIKIGMESVAGITETTMKKTLGRRIIPIRKIEKKHSRLVTFSKRRSGLFKKASQLSTQCGSEIAVIVFSESGKAFSFGHPSAESVIQRYVLESNSPPSGAQSACNGVRKFGNSEEVIQWENRISMLGLNELQSYANCLQKIRDSVALKVASMASTSGDVAESDHGEQNSSIDDLLVQDNFYDDKKCELVSDQENQKSCSDDLLVQDNCFDDVKRDLISDEGNQKSTSDDLLEENCSDDAKGELVADDQGNKKSSSDGLNVQDDDVNWRDIESYMAKSPVMSSDFWNPFEAESQYNYMDFGDGMMEQSDALPSSSCLEVDSQFESSLCGIQWEKEEDIFGLFA